MASAPRRARSVSGRSIAWRPAAIAAFIVLGVAASRPVGAQVVISQVYGGGGNTGAPLRNDFVELFNRGTSPASLAGMSVQYASATGTGLFSGNPIATLSGTLQPGQYYLVQLGGGTNGALLPTPDAVGTTPMGSGAGKAALVNSTTGLACNGGSTPCSVAQVALIVDLVGYGNANFFEGAGAAPTLSNTTAALRQNSGCTDTNSNLADFTAGTPNPRNSASPLWSCVAPPTNPSGTGSASPAAVLSGQSSLMTVAVTPGANPSSTGLAVSVDLSAIGGSATQPFFDDGTNGDVTSGDLVFSWLATVTSSTSAGAKSLGATISDAQARTGTTTITLDVILTCTTTHTIAEVQGSTAASTLDGSTVTTRGVVYARRSNGFYVQMPTGDADETTSDGLFVFTSSSPPATAAVGNDVCVTGPVLEFVPASDPHQPPLTEISQPTSVIALSSGNPLPAPTPITAETTSGPDATERLERLEGMRVMVDSLTVVAPTAGSVNETNATGSSNGVFFGVVTGVGRPFREAGIDTNDPLPAGAPCCVPRYDGNPERLRVDSDAQPSAARLDVTTGAVVKGLVGPLDYAFRTYSIFPDAGSASVSGNRTFTAAPAPRADEVTVASLNLERFYNTSNDAGADTVLTAQAFQNRLEKASLTIRNVLRLPDVLAVVEAENLSTLQALTAKVNDDVVGSGGPDPAYVAFLEEGNDLGGIDVGFLVKTARVSALNVEQVGKDATYTNPNTGDQDVLNDRPPLVLDARTFRPTGEAFDFTVVVNHLRSLIDIGDATSGARVRAKRRAQAEFLADLVQDLQAANPGTGILTVGDFNAFEVNDGYVDVIGTIGGQPAPADQVVLASEDLVSPDLVNLTSWLPPGERYSYVFDGNAQAIDHALVNAPLAPWVSRFHYGRSNADFPEVYRSDASRPERLSDHDGSVTYLALGTPRLTSRAGQGDGYVDLQVTNIGGANAFGIHIDQVRFKTLAGVGTVTLGASALPVDLPDLAAGASATVRLFLNVPPGVTRFSMTENGQFVDAGGMTYRFSMGRAIVP